VIEGRECSATLISLARKVLPTNSGHVSCLPGTESDTNQPHAYSPYPGENSLLFERQKLTLYNTEKERVNVIGGSSVRG